MKQRFCLSLLLIGFWTAPGVLTVEPCLAAPVTKTGAASNKSRAVSASPRSNARQGQARQSNPSTTDPCVQRELARLNTVPEPQRQEFLSALEQATTQYNNGKFQEAEKGFEKAAALFPASFQAHYYRSACLTKLGRNQDSLIEIKKALEIEPNNDAALLALPGVQTQLGDIEQGMKSYELYAQKFPKDPYASEARRLAESLKFDVQRNKELEEEKESEDYFKAATYDMCMKWPMDKFPLKVYLPSASEASKVPFYRKEYSDVVRAAFDEWQTASNNLASFTFVTDAKAADIECIFSNNREHCEFHEGGRSVPCISVEVGIISTKIFLLTDKELLPARMKTVALHEIGHTLGLWDHSPNAKDVMFFAALSDALSDRDTKTLIHLYQPDVKIASHIHQRTGTNSVFAMNDEAMRLINAKQYGEAIKKFEAILKISPGNEIIRFNLASALNIVGSQFTRQGKFAEAEPIYRRSLSYSNDKRIAAQVHNNLWVVYRGLNKPKEAEEHHKTVLTLDPNFYKEQK